MTPRVVAADRVRVLTVPSCSEPASRYAFPSDLVRLGAGGSPRWMQLWVPLWVCDAGSSPMVAQVCDTWASEATFACSCPRGHGGHIISRERRAGLPVMRLQRTLCA